MKTFEYLEIKGNKLFDMVESQLSLNYVCEIYPNTTNQILSQLEGIVPREVPDSLFFNFYLNPNWKGV